MDYIPPAGRFGHLIASLLGNNPKRVVREDLRNFKRIMEIGEILTIIGQPTAPAPAKANPTRKTNGVRCSRDRGPPATEGKLS